MVVTLGNCWILGHLLMIELREHKQFVVVRRLAAWQGRIVQEQEGKPALIRWGRELGP